MKNKRHENLELLKNNFQFTIFEFNFLDNKSIFVGIMLDDNIIHIQNNSFFRFFVNSINISRLESKFCANLKKWGLKLRVFFEKSIEKLVKCERF